MKKRAYENALANPESLVAFFHDPTVEAFFFEEFPFAVVESSWNDLTLDQILTREPTGLGFQTIEELQSRFPKLWATFQESGDRWPRDDD